MPAALLSSGACRKDEFIIQVNQLSCFQHTFLFRRNFVLTLHPLLNICRFGQNRISAPYMTLCMVISLLKLPYVHRIYL